MESQEKAMVDQKHFGGVKMKKQRHDKKSAKIAAQVRAERKNGKNHPRGEME